MTVLGEMTSTERAQLNNSTSVILAGQWMLLEQLPDIWMIELVDLSEESSYQNGLMNDLTFMTTFREWSQLNDNS